MASHTCSVIRNGGELGRLAVDGTTTGEARMTREVAGFPSDPMTRHRLKGSNLSVWTGCERLNPWEETADRHRCRFALHSQSGRCFVRRCVAILEHRRWGRVGAYRDDNYTGPRV